MCTRRLRGNHFEAGECTIVAALRQPSQTNPHVLARSSPPAAACPVLVYGSAHGSPHGLAALAVSLDLLPPPQAMRPVAKAMSASRFIVFVLSAFWISSAQHVAATRSVVAAWMGN